MDSAGDQASIRKRTTLSCASGTQASQAPLGQTRTGTPSTASRACPVPTVPSRKAESRPCTVA
jgi:hypothetical protein